MWHSMHEAVSLVCLNGGSLPFGVCVPNLMDCFFPLRYPESDGIRYNGCWETSIHQGIHFNPFDSTVMGNFGVGSSLRDWHVLSLEDSPS